MEARHDTNVRYIVDSTGAGHLAMCTCGWTTAHVGTAGYAEALAEQHVQSSARRTRS